MFFFLFYNQVYFSECNILDIQVVNVLRQKEVPSNVSDMERT